MFIMFLYTPSTQSDELCNVADPQIYSSDKDYGPVTNVKYCRFKKRIAVLLLLPHELFLSYVFVPSPITYLC